MITRAERRANEYTCWVRNKAYDDFLKGYHQAEKDLALIPEDIGVILNLVQHCRDKYNSIEECYSEVLETFNKARLEYV